VNGGEWRRMEVNGGEWRLLMEAINGVQWSYRYG